MGPAKLLFAILTLGLFAGCGGGGGNTVSNSDNGALPTDSVSGTVTFKGAPLAGATVTAFLTNTNSFAHVTTTDANGNYSFTGLQAYGNVPSDYQFWVNKAGYGFYPAVGSGGTVTRFDYTGQFTGNGVTDIAIYFTVIDYVALPNGSLSGANFAAFDGSNPLLSLAKTGQTTSYTSGDDGAQQKGMAWPATRFVDNSNGTVTDNLTGLIWLKDAGCLPAAVWASALAEANQLASGQCGLNDGSSLGQWRLPNINELESVVDVSQASPAVSANSHFVNVSGGVYWSSTSYWGGQGGSPGAWTIRFSDGRYMNDTTSNVKATAANHVWAVKGSGGGAIKLASTGMYVSYVNGDDGNVRAGVPLTYPRFIDNGNGTLTDTMTGLIWLKKADCVHQDWSTAIATVNALASGQCGLTDGSSAGDWRMPNRGEMQSLSDRMENNHADFFNQSYTWKANNMLYQPPIFSNFKVSEFYWTSSTDAADTTEAWTVFSCDYGVYDTPKVSPGYTLAVR